MRFFLWLLLINHLSLSLLLHPAPPPPPPELLPPVMDSLDSNRVDIFEIYRRYCDIRSGNIYKENNNQLDDETQSGKRSRDELAHLLKFVELNVHTRASIFDELAKLKSKVEFMVDYSEFSCFYDFVYFMCREKCQKNITVSKAVAAWRLVLAGRFRLLKQWCDFVQENQRHNISEDTWQQVLAFSRCVHENLEGYDPEGAWPVLIDDFVEHMYRVSGPNKDLNVFCNCGDSESQSCAFEDALPGLKITPGLKRKMPNFEDEMDVTDSPSPGFAGLHIAPNSKRNRLISHRRMSLGNSAGDCMEIIKHSSQLGSSKSPCAVEGCLSKGFAGLFSSRSYLQLDHERRLSFT